MTDPLKSVLVLDDCEDLLLISKVLIERICNREAVTVRNLREIESLGEKAFSCEMAILDINLGANEPNGVDVYHWLRRGGFVKPIYFLTGHARTFPLVAEAERLGDAKVLSKPIASDELIRIILGGGNA